MVTWNGQIKALDNTKLLNQVGGLSHRVFVAIEVALVPNEFVMTLAMMILVEMSPDELDEDEAGALEQLIMLAVIIIPDNKKNIVIKMNPLFMLKPPLAYIQIEKCGYLFNPESNIQG